MDRYDCVTGLSESPADCVKRENGEWVAYEDAAREIESLRQCLEGACEERDQAQDERDELREQIKEQDRAYSDLSQLCNLKVADEAAQRKRAEELQRRLKLMWGWMNRWILHPSYLTCWCKFVQQNPEAEQWFEEGRDDG